MIPITDPVEQAEVDRRCRAVAGLRTHEFTLILSAGPTEARAETFCSICDDATLAVTTGVGHIRFHREANSLEVALRSALSDVKAAGLRVERVEMEPDAISLAT